MFLYSPERFSLGAFFVLLLVSVLVILICK